MKKILVVFNSRSGRQKAFSYKRIIFKRFKEEGIAFKFIYISLLPLIKDIEKYDTIVAVGGDGTVLGVLPYIVNSSRKLGIIPCGTANLFAEGLLIPSNINKALDIILSDKTSDIDIGKADNQYFSLRCGLGYDADIINGAKTGLKNKIGYLAYFLQGIISLFKLNRKTYKIKIDGREIIVNASSVIISNAGNMFKNLFTVAPKGAVDDGKLDIFILCAKNFLDFVEVFMQILFGFHHPNSKVMYAQAATVSIVVEDESLHIDGENRKLPHNLNISVLPEAVKVFVP